MIMIRTRIYTAACISTHALASVTKSISSPYTVSCQYNAVASGSQVMRELPLPIAEGPLPGAAPVKSVGTAVGTFGVVDGAVAQARSSLHNSAGRRDTTAGRAAKGIVFVRATAGVSTAGNMVEVDADSTVSGGIRVRGVASSTERVARAKFGWLR